MRLAQMRRIRPFLEQLEDRCNPTFIGGWSTAGGTLTMIGTETAGTFAITQTGATQFNVNDSAGFNMTFTSVTGLNINVNSIVADGTGFTPSLTLNGSFGNVLGSVTLNFSRSLVTAANVATSTVDVTVNNTVAASSIIGTTKITTTSAGASTVTIDPTTALTLNNLSITTAGGLTNASGINIAQKVVNLGDTAGATVTLKGGVTLSSMNRLRFATGRVVNVNGSVNATIRPATTSAISNRVDIGSAAGTNTDTITGGVFITTGLGNYSVNIQDVNIFSTVSVNFSPAAFNNLNIATNNNVFIGGALTVNGGTASATTLTAGSATTTLFMSGSVFSFTAGNGDNTLNLTNISASNTVLTVSVGNGTNLVAFDPTGNALFKRGTLVGGYGSNSYTGFVSFPITVFNFS